MITLFFNLLVTIIHAYLDAEKIKKHEYIDHFWRSVVYFFVCFSAVVSIDLLSEQFDLYPFVGLLMIVYVRFVVFDLMLNHFRNFPLNYTSIKTGSTIDKFFMKNNFNPFILKVIGLILLLAMYVISFFIKHF